MKRNKEFLIFSLVLLILNFITALPQDNSELSINFEYEKPSIIEGGNYSINTNYSDNSGMLEGRNTGTLYTYFKSLLDSVYSPILDLSDYWNLSERGDSNKSLNLDSRLILSGTVGTLFSSAPDYYISFNTDDTVISSSNSSKYFIRITNGTSKGYQVIIQNIAPGSPFGEDGVITISDSAIWNGLSSGNTFELYYQEDYNPSLSKIAINGLLEFWGLGSTLNVVIPTGTTTKPSDSLFYMKGGDNADYYSGSGRPETEPSIIKLANGGGYVTDAGNGENFYIYSGKGGTPAFNGGNASIIHFVLEDGGAGATNGKNGKFRIGSLTDYVEFQKDGTGLLQTINVDGIHLGENQKIYFGDSDESSIYINEDGNLVVNSQEVGSGNVLLKGNSKIYYERLQWKDLRGTYRVTSNAQTSFGDATYSYNGLLQEGLTNYVISTYILPSDAFPNGTVQIMMDFVGNGSIITGVNDLIRLNVFSGGFTKNQGGQYIVPSSTFTLNLSKYGYTADKYFNINIKNLTNMNPEDYFSIAVYRYGADAGDTFNYSLATPYTWRVKYQSEKVI